jgi:hypothetical protein
MEWYCKRRGRLFIAMLVAWQAAHARPPTEVVMHEGTAIIASKNGTSIKIVAGDGIERTYEFDHCTLKSHMSRRYGRWYGSLGLYDPAPSFGVGLFPPTACNGITRTVVEEGQIHFNDMHFVDAWIRRQQSTIGNIGQVVWTNDGLLVSWAVVPGRYQLNVDVWLICINSQRPQTLTGATDSAITVLANSSLQTTHDCAAVGKEVAVQTRRELEESWSTPPVHR